MPLERCTDFRPVDDLSSAPSADTLIVRAERDRLSTVLMHLYIQYPFWGSLLSQTRLEPDLTLHTYGATDGLDYIWYNPLLTRTLSHKQLAFLLLHEIMHIAFQHFARQHTREQRRWNYACDYAINPLARDAQSALKDLNRLQQVELIPHILLDPAYENLFAELIYDRLPTQLTLPTGSVQLDEHRPFPKDADRHERLIGKLLAAHQQWEKHDRRGTLPAGLLLQIDQLRSSATPWTRILRQWSSRHLGHDESSYAPPHRRRLIRDGLIAPRTYGLQTGMLVLSLDTSGSMSRDAITDGLTEIEHLSDLCEEVLILTHDAAVHDVIRTKDVIQFWQNLRTRTATIHGGGGTSHVPIFDWLSTHRIRPDLLIAFTDLATEFPSLTPRFPVLWATTPEHAHTVVPFGTILSIVPLAQVSR